MNFRIPHVFIFLSAIILFGALLTYIVPSGTFEREVKVVEGVEQNIVVPGSYEQLPKHFSLKSIVLGEHVEGKATPVSILGLFTSIPRGMNQAASLIFFVFIIGAVFSLIQHTGTISIVMYYLMSRFRNAKIFLLLIIYFFIFMAASLFGMGAEFIPMIPLFLIIAKEMNYDRIFGIALFVIPMTVGWTAALTNPFNLQIAQIIAEVPIGSGMGLRLIFFVLSFTFGFLFLLNYGRKVKMNWSNSIMSDDEFILDEESKLEKKPLERRHILIMIVAFILFGLILYAVQTMGWGMIEMSGGFFMVGLSTILISGMSGGESMKAFTKGLETMIVPALIVGFARGIQVVIFEGQIVDTILHSVAQVLQELPTIYAAEGMLAFQSVLNFFIPSASGQAMVAMPLMVPLSDLLNITRQSTVLVFVLGDGLSNIIIPTSGTLMAILGIAKVPYERWFVFIYPLFIILTIVAIIMVAVAIQTGY